ncbi:MAG: glycosyltransferase family 2 protein [Thermaceae bacterium]
MKDPATILIPAFNEEATIAQVVQTAQEAGLDVLVVDDASQDATAQKAEEAGARVVRLPQNRGKGGAVAEGARRVETPYLLLLDADLLGLRPHHLHALLAPVVEGRAEMSVGVFRKGRASTDWAMRLAPFLSGQRALRTEDLLGVEGLERARYGLEILLTRHAKKKGWRVVYLPLEGVSQVMKEEKRGFLPGLSHRMRMYWEILKGFFG